jgi:hypothetical protein
VAFRFCFFNHTSSAGPPHFKFSFLQLNTHKNLKSTHDHLLPRDTRLKDFVIEIERLFFFLFFRLLLHSVHWHYFSIEFFFSFQPSYSNFFSLPVFLSVQAIHKTKQNKRRQQQRREHTSNSLPSFLAQAAMDCSFLPLLSFFLWESVEVTRYSFRLHPSYPR